MDIKILGDTPPWDWPEDAGATFLEVLADREADEDDRTLAAELAGDECAMNDELAAALLGVLGAADEPEALRGRAAISLGPALEQADTYGFDDPEDVMVTEDMFGRVKDTLRALFHDDNVPLDVRRRVLEAAVRAQADWHAEPIRKAYASDDETWKLTAVFCMKYVGGFEDEILVALSSDDDAIRYEALLAAGNWGVKAAWPHVATILGAEGPDTNMLIGAIDAAAAFGDEESIDALESFADHDDEDVVEATFTALAMTGRDADSFDEDAEGDEKDNNGRGKGRKFPPHMLS